MRGLKITPKWHLISRSLLWVYRLDRGSRAFRLVALLVGLLLAGLLAFALRHWLMAV